MPEPTPTPEGERGPRAAPAGAPSLEADLRAAREARDLTLPQIQQETRIPADVLQRLEGGQLLSDPSFNEVYVRALLKAYAQAVGVSAHDVTLAYDAQREGRYAGLGVHDTTSPGQTEPGPDAHEPPTAGNPAEDQPVAASSARAVAPAVAALGRAEPVDATAVPPPPEPIVKHRVARPETVGAKRAFDRSWGLIAAVAGVLALVFAALLWFLFRDRTPEPEPRPEVAADTTQAPDTTARPAEQPEPAATAAPRLQLPIRVTVTARGDGLQSFRVSEAPGDRRPYWMEAGVSQTFESPQEVVLWGEGAAGGFEDATVELQGFRWTPPGTAPVRINAAAGQALLDSLARAPGATPPSAPAPGTPPPR